MRVLKGYLQLVRPFNSILVFISVWVGGFAATKGAWLPAHFIWAGTAFAFIAAGGYVINDLFDVKIDRVNRPDRPLPRGIVSQRGALIYTLVLFGIGNLLAFQLTLICFSIALTTTVLLVIYSAWLKKTPLSGNVLVALLAGLTFVFGGAATGSWGAALIPAVFAGLFHLGREIVKDMEDVVGDMEQGAITLPILAGMGVARILVTIIFALLGVLTFVPYVLHWYGGVYVWSVVLGVDVVLGMCVWLLWKTTLYGLISRILKIDMLIGLLCVCIGIAIHS